MVQSYRWGVFEMRTSSSGLQISFQVEHLIGFDDWDYAKDLNWKICIKAQNTSPQGYQ